MDISAVWNKQQVKHVLIVVLSVLFLGYGLAILAEYFSPKNTMPLPGLLTFALLPIIFGLTGIMASVVIWERKC